MDKINWRKLKPYTVKVNDVDLDGGVPIAKDWVKESDQLSKEMNNDKEDSKTNVIPLKPRQKSA